MRNFRRLLGNQRGQIMQAGIAAIVTLGATVIAINMNQAQKKAQLRNQFVVKTTEIEARIRNAIQNERAWGLTVASASNTTPLDCLRGTPSTNNNCVGDEGVITRVFDASGVAFITSSPQGFRLDGSTCNTFVSAPGTGNEECPYGVTVRWQPVERGQIIEDRRSTTELPSGTDCTDTSAFGCDVRIIVEFEFNGGNLDMQLNSANYYIDFSRQNSGSFQELIVMRREPTNRNAGQCTAGDWENRKFNVVLNDTGNNVSGVTQNYPAAATSDSFNLQPGTYSCEVTAPAAIPFAHQAKLVVDGVDYPGTSAYYYTPSYVKATFTITAVATVEVKHYCEQALSANRDEEFGKAITGGQDNIYTVVRCIKKLE